VRGQEGFALAAALAVMLLVTLTVAAAAAVLLDRTLSTGIAELRAQAALAADSGVFRAAVLLAGSPAAWAGDGPPCTDPSGYTPLPDASGPVAGITGIKFPASADVSYRPGPPDASMRTTLCVRSDGRASGFRTDARHTVYARLARRPARVGTAAFAPGIRGHVTGIATVYGSVYADGTIDLLGDSAFLPDPGGPAAFPGYRDIVSATRRIEVGGSAQIGSPSSPVWGVFSPDIVGADRIHALVTGPYAPTLSRTPVREALDSLRTTACAVVPGNLRLGRDPVSLPCLTYTPGDPARLEVAGTVVVLGDVEIEPHPSGNAEVVWTGTGLVAAAGDFRLAARIVSSAWPDQVPQLAWTGEGEIRAKGAGTVHGIFVADGEMEIKGPDTQVTGIVAAGGLDLDGNPVIRQDLRALRSVLLQGSSLLPLLPGRVAIVEYSERGVQR